MKANSLLAAGALGWLLAGCATADKGLLIESVGPDPAAAASLSAANGTLVVYSAYEVNADFNIRDQHRPEYSDYRIFTADGKLLAWVHNSTDTILQRPRMVELPPGLYRVLAPANGFGLVRVPVTIAAGKETVVHLEGGNRWPNPGAFNAANSVRLPDGEVVGWKNPAGAQ